MYLGIYLLLYLLFIKYMYLCIYLLFITYMYLCIYLLFIIYISSLYYIYICTMFLLTLVFISCMFLLSTVCFFLLLFCIDMFNLHLWLLIAWILNQAQFLQLMNTCLNNHISTLVNSIIVNNSNNHGMYSHIINTIFPSLIHLLY
jgi:hypothetical protein